LGLIFFVVFMVRTTRSPSSYIDCRLPSDMLRWRSDAGLFEGLDVYHAREATHVHRGTRRRRDVGGPPVATK